MVLAALLVVGLLGIILLGFVVMRRIDRFMESGGITDSLQGRANNGVLVFGAPEAVAKMAKAGIKCAELTEPALPEDGSYSALFALSGDDMANLALCHAAKKADPGITVVARCGSPELRGVFADAGADCLLTAGEAIGPLLARLRGDGV